MLYNLKAKVDKINDTNNKKKQKMRHKGAFCQCGLIIYAS